MVLYLPMRSEIKPESERPSAEPAFMMAIMLNDVRALNPWPRA